MAFALSLQNAPTGRYDGSELPEGAVFALVQKGETQPPETGQIEAHRRYADVQIMLDGGEAVCYCDIEGLKEVVPDQDDIVFYANAGQSLNITRGCFM